MEEWKSRRKRRKKKKKKLKVRDGGEKEKKYNKNMAAHSCRVNGAVLALFGLCMQPKK